MSKRYAAIWFRHLTTDWFVLRQPLLKNLPFVFAAPERGRMVITAASPSAESQGIAAGTAVADAKAFLPGLQVFEDKPGLSGKLLKTLGLWCIRYTPVITVDYPDGLILDISGCAHLWGGERAYLKEIGSRLKSKGYDVRAAIADTIGAAWAVSRFGQVTPIIESGLQAEALLSLPPAALRLEPGTVQRLQKLGLYRIKNLIGMPRTALQKRFGEGLLRRLRQALGQEEEYIQPLQPIVPYEERLPCLEPIRTAAGIEVALQRLLEMLCKRLSGEGKGLRTAILTCYRVDGKLIKISIGTNRATSGAGHIFKLFELKIPQIKPGLGIELFLLQAIKVEDADPVQEAFWSGKPGLEDRDLSELLDRLAGKAGAGIIHRYLPDEHHWPERSFKEATSIGEKPAISWPSGRPRPAYLLPRPEAIEVSAPVPDYPPMLFRYKGKVHQVRKADGPERIEREWWLEKGERRDYYYVEDEQGQRYWLFRSGHYAGNQPQQWFIHGFFA
ncbi:protein ImuB [Anseongella ginsenosidimutans]|uniref:Protein ImuB n=1 Tax=Anseongella ginsenosidimutans TaxID=496056 RepID=A0A4R3KNE7_9SPHI|nr:DNA polymerase Y family protein [Anseongella ginsenosidimutans]QEC53732.1 DNA polymerase Y family protein [Anseongella ginsenosidimutans]TCS86013.1 protein ImuB [Anseongella ginsenosidimutans]